MFGAGRNQGSAGSSHRDFQRHSILQNIATTCTTLQTGEAKASCSSRLVEEVLSFIRHTRSLHTKYVL